MSCTKYSTHGLYGHLSSLIHDNEDGYSDMTTDRARAQSSQKQGKQRAQRPQIEQVARLQLGPGPSQRVIDDPDQRKQLPASGGAAQK